MESIPSLPEDEVIKTQLHKNSETAKEMLPFLQLSDRNNQGLTKFYLF